MRILVIIDSLGTGGAEFSTLSFYSWLLTNRLATVKLISLKKAEPEYDYQNMGVLDVQYLTELTFRTRLVELQKICGVFKPDIVHSVLFQANILGRFLRIATKGFMHIESLVNEMYSKHRLDDPNINLLKLEAYRWFDFSTQLFGVDHFQANGLSVAKHYQQKLHLDKKRITIIPRGRKSNDYVDDNETKINIRNEFHADNRLLLINVGRQEFQKGQDILLEALSQIPELKDRYKLLLVGRFGKFSDDLKTKITKHDLGENVELLGFRSDVPQLLAASDIFLFPSRFEGLPGALIEAEAAGLPIICSDIPNNVEVVNNQNAIICPVNSPEMFASAIRELISNQTKRTSMGKKSFQIYNEKFTIERIHDRMYELFKSLKDNTL